MPIKYIVFSLLFSSIALAQDQAKAVLLGHSSGVNSIALSPDGKTLVSGAKDETLRFWDLGKNEAQKMISMKGSSVKRVSYDHAGTKLLAAGYGRFTEFDLKKGKQKQSKKNSHSAFIETCTYSQDDQLILTSSWRDHSLCIWTSGSLKKQIDLKEDNWIDNACFNKNATLVFSGGHDNLIKVWDVATGNMIYSMAGHEDWVYDISLSLDEKTVYSAGFDKVIKVWDLNSRKNTATLKGHSEGIVCLDLSNDGKYLASGGTDKEIIIWDLSEKKEVKRIKAHSETITDLKFSADGKTLYSCSLDKSIKVWDLSSL